MKRGPTYFPAFRIMALAALLAGLSSAVRAAVQQWMDYFQPTPIISPLSSTCWGAAQVGPRDQSNGLEDKTLTSWDYWDGGIIKDETSGTYHMFASRWSKSRGHNGWMSDSRCVHATSTNLYGPYADKGQCFTDNGGMCHNVNALKLKTGDTCGKKFAISCSGSVGGSGRVYGADSLDGPWTYIGDLKLDLNGHTGRFLSGDNFRTILRPDGQYGCINGLIGLADNVLGPYKAQMSGKFTDVIPGHIPDSCRNNMEDPYMFYSGNQYHVFYNCWSAKKAFFYSSPDGISNWKMEDGYGYDPTSNMVRYTDGTVNHWELLERPSVYIENGHAVAMTFAAINSPKDQDTASTKNGSKVIVVPVDGLSYDSGGPPGSVVASGGAGGGLDAGSGTGGKGGTDGGAAGAGGSSAGGRGVGGTSTGGAGGGGGTSAGGAGGGARGGAGGAGGRTASGGTGGAGAGGSGAGGTSNTTTSAGAGGSGGTSGGGSGGMAGGAGGGTGGTSSSGGHATGGATTGSGGSSAGGGGRGGSGSGGTSTAKTSQSSGCSCTIQGPGSASDSRARWGWLLGIAVVLAFRRATWAGTKRRSSLRLLDRIMRRWALLGSLTAMLLVELVPALCLADNPIIQTKYTADPAPMVHGDTLYLYTSHDEDNATGFTMYNYLLYTSTDMVNWTDHGIVAGVRDPYKTWKWADGHSAWAPQVAFRNKSVRAPHLWMSGWLPREAAEASRFGWTARRASWWLPARCLGQVVRKLGLPRLATSAGQRRARSVLRVHRRVRGSVQFQLVEVLGFGPQPG